MASQQLGSKLPSCFRFRYNAERETPADTRNLLLIVVTLIAAVTFQAGVNPPGGVWQEDGHDRHKAGRAIYAEQRVAFTVFLSANTLAFSLAIQIIVSLTYKFPFYGELWTATISMFVTYASAIFAVAPDESIKFRYVLSAGALPFGYQLLKKLYRTYQWSQNHSADQNATKPVEFKRRFCM